MRIIEGLDSFTTLTKPVLTTGTFDGVHFGHQYIIAQLNRSAAQLGGESVLVTFYPHPRQVLYPEQDPVRMLNTQAEKLVLLQKSGLHNALIITFTHEFAATSSLDFIRKILVERIGVRKVIIGYDHNFGKNKEGNFDFLHELGKYYHFDVEEIEAQDVGHVSVSSTKVRQALERGDIPTVNAYLNHHHLMAGTVVHDTRLGRKIGYPTACLNLGENTKLLPPAGVYIAWAEWNNQYYRALVNLHAIDPDAKDLPRNKKINVHLLDFDQQIYGEWLHVWLVDRLRDEVKTPELQSLRNLIKNDIGAARRILTTPDMLSNDFKLDKAAQIHFAS